MPRPAVRSPAPDAVARAAAALDALVPGQAPLGLAVSGGPDSLALLLLVHAAQSGLVQAATVDHGLRAEAADEAAMVADVCATLGVPHTTLAVTVADGNVQAEARTARYAALGAWAERAGLAAIATAHHADDQAETLLMRLNRASGVSGLAGVRARGRVAGVPVPVVRPLLDWRRADLAEVVQAAGLTPAQDPSNLDPAYDRVRVRAALVEADWLDVAAIAQSAAHLAEADQALDWAAGREWAERVVAEPLAVVWRPQAPRAVGLRVLGRIVRELGGEEQRGGALARAFDALVRGQTVSIGALVARPGHDGWRFMKAPARRA